MSDIETTKDLYRLYVRRFGDCPRTPYQAEYYRKWLDLLNSCSSNEEAEAKSKENGLYSAGAAAVAMDRVYANKVAAEKKGWSDVADFCCEVIEKIKADPYYSFTHNSLWADIQALKSGWLRTIEGFHRLFADFIEYDNTRSDAARTLSKITDDVKMLSKPSSDFATLASMPSFRALIECGDEYYQEFVFTIGKAISSGQLETMSWNTLDYLEMIEDLWEKRDLLGHECKEWYRQGVKPPHIRLSPDTPDGKYELIDLD
ncbi:MAG: hypothetical protein J6L98_04145 [Bacteroidales bacterium]|nr:hypothetical protein [Bacteroidales bacterium]